MFDQHASFSFAEGRMLPLEAFRSDEVLDLELERIFATEWLCVARTADIPEPGNFITAVLPTLEGDRSIVVVRDDDRTVRAFDNVCVHRGAELVEGRGHNPRFTCPYHAWVYRLDGSLAATPYLSGTTEFDGSPFDAEAHRLADVRTEVWEGFVFASLSSDTPPLAERLSGFTQLLSRYHMAGYVPVHSSVDVWSTNWKLLVENFLDPYHVFKVHKNSFGVDGDNTRFTHLYPGTDHWTHHRVVNPDDPDLCTPQNSSLEGDWRKTIVLGGVFPGFVLQLQPDWLWFLQITPLGTDHVRIAWQVAVAPDILTGHPSPQQFVAEVVDLVHLVNSEDRPVVEGIGRNVNRAQFERSPLSYLEQNVFDFDRYVSRRLSES